MEEEAIEGAKDEKISLYYTHGKIFVWNYKDVMRLRREYRIVGNLVGCLPRAPRQNSHLGLPLQLAPYEAKLLVDKGVGEIVMGKKLDEREDEEKVKIFNEMRQKSYEEQVPLFKEARRKEIEQHKHIIVEGKKAKKRKLQQLHIDSGEGTNNQDGSQNKNQEKPDDGREMDVQEKVEDAEDKCGIKTNGNAILKSDTEVSMSENQDGGQGSHEDEFNIDEIEIHDIKPDHAIVQLFTESPWHPETTLAYNYWSYPQMRDEELQYHVFQDLWNQNYYLTSGNKFGGDFLVYPGDPAVFHSFYIAVCLPHEEKLTSLEIVTLGRLGANVRKTVLLCSEVDGKINYTSLQWTGIT